MKLIYFVSHKENIWHSFIVFIPYCLLLLKIVLPYKEFYYFHYNEYIFDAETV